jgi:hypothetical protein
MPDHATTEALAFVTVQDLGMGEDDARAGRPVLKPTGELSVEAQFVARKLRVVRDQC